MHKNSGSVMNENKANYYALVTLTFFFCSEQDNMNGTRRKGR